MPGMSSPSQVLVVDDDEGLGLLVIEALRERGLFAQAVLSGKQALNVIARNPPELLLLDLRLADASGASILAQIREQGLTLPFIVVTGQGDERVAVEMMKQGALDYVIKDAGMLDRLPHVVARALEKLGNQRALTAAQAALVESEKQILAVSEGERQRIGADLHDNLGQQLTAIELLCQSLREDLHGQPKLEQRMAQICHFLRESVAQTRQLAHGLTPIYTSKDGLEDGLAAMTRRMSTDKVRCEFIYEGPVVVQDNNVATHLYRIAQEAVNNALKHAHASVVTVTLSQAGDTVSLVIADNGRGFSKGKQTGSGIGLEIMRHRANVIGAVLEAESKSSNGVVVTCTLKGSS